MSQYMVNVNLLRADPLLDIGQLTDIVMEKILPSLEALKDLQSHGKVLAGGHPVGQRYVVLFLEAESEDEEVRELLGELLGELRPLKDRPSGLYQISIPCRNIFSGLARSLPLLHKVQPHFLVGVFDTPAFYLCTFALRFPRM